MKFSDTTQDFLKRLLSSDDVIRKEENDITVALLAYRQPFGENEKRYQIYFCNKYASDVVCLELEKDEANRFTAVCIFLTLKKALFAK